MNQDQEKSSHTPEPWHVATKNGDDDLRFDDVMSGKLRVCNVYGGQSYPPGKANADRIVACVNALAGLNPEALKDVVEALELLSNPINYNDKKFSPTRVASEALSKLRIKGS